MDTVSKLTVFFEDPFWVGIYERQQGSQLEVARIVFGSEPKDYEVFLYLTDNWYNLHFSIPVYSVIKEKLQHNPKRRQKAARAELRKQGSGTKSQEALKIQHEQSAARRKTGKRLRSEEEKQRLFELKQQKRKEKHKGR